MNPLMQTLLQRYFQDQGDPAQTGGGFQLPEYRGSMGQGGGRGPMMGQGGSGAPGGMNMPMPAAPPQAGGMAGPVQSGPGGGGESVARLPQGVNAGTFVPPRAGGVYSNMMRS